MTAHMRRKMLANLLQPTRTKQLHEVVAAQEQWEAALLEYQTVSGVKLPEDALVVSFISMMPEKLEEDMNRLDMQFVTLTDVKSYVQKQVRSKRNLVKNSINHVTEEPGLKWNYNQYTGEIEAVAGHLGIELTDENWNTLGSLVTGKSKGKSEGKGEGKGKGPCFHCGGYGHVLSSCPKYDEVMKQLRTSQGNDGQGKSGKSGKGLGKSGFHNYGQGKGVGKSGKSNNWTENKFMGLWNDPPLDNQNMWNTVVGTSGAGSTTDGIHSMMEYSVPTKNAFEALQQEEQDITGDLQDDNDTGCLSSCPVCCSCHEPAPTRTSQKRKELHLVHACPRNSFD